MFIPTGLSKGNLTRNIGLQPYTPELAGRSPLARYLPSGMGMTSQSSPNWNPMMLGNSAVEPGGEFCTISAQTIT